MPLPEPRPGLVICYSYLWHDERRRGALEGGKNRRCAVVLTAKDEDGVELPPAAKRRLGLDDARPWIVVTELNRLIWPGYDLRSIGRDRPDEFAFGFLPVETFVTLKAAVSKALRMRRTSVVGRD